MSSTKSSPAGTLLQRQLKEINTANDLSGISVGLVRDSNVFEWEVSLMINDDCKYYGGACFSSLPHHSLFIYSPRRITRAAYTSSPFRGPNS
jgi:ubiquitin-protein ligase